MSNSCVFYPVHKVVTSLDLNKDRERPPSTRRYHTNNTSNATTKQLDSDHGYNIGKLLAVPCVCVPVLGSTSRSVQPSSETRIANHVSYHHDIDVVDYGRQRP